MYQTFTHTFGIHQRALRLLLDKRLLPYLLYSGFITLMMSFLLFFSVVQQSYAAYKDVLNSWSEKTGIIAHTLLIIRELLPIVLIILVAFLLFKSLIVIINGPIFAKLSQKTEEILTGNITSLEGTLLQQVQRTIRMSFWSVSRELMMTIPCLLLHLIPGLGSILFTIIVFFIQSYYAGANYMDFVLERHGYNSHQSIAYMKSKNAALTGIGTAFMLLILIPIVGAILGPALSVVSATIYYVEEK